MDTELPNSNNMIEILSLESRIDHFKFLLQRGIPVQILNNCQLITIPNDREEIYQHHYGIIQNGRFFHDIPFSSEDFMLAYLATELHASVISYDHHLLNMIGHYLNYEAFWPEDIPHINESRTFLLDCNILIEFQAHESDHRSAIERMFCEKQHDFLIPEPILVEYKRLTLFNKRNLRMNSNKKQNKKSKSNLENKPHIFPEDIEQYIDNFEQIEPKRMQKGREQQKKDFCDKSSQEPKVEYKDFVAKRYKGLAKQFVFDEHIR